MTRCLQRLKQRWNITLEFYERHTKTLRAVGEKLREDCELLCKSEAKEENHPKLKLLKKTEEETQMDELEVTTVDYHDNIVLPEESPCSDDWQSEQQQVCGARGGLVMWAHIQADWG